VLREERCATGGSAQTDTELDEGNQAGLHQPIQAGKASAYDGAWNRGGNEKLGRASDLMQIKLPTER
jgi:hypothetical protein